MLSYRHAFHAGNHADVLKHFVLYAVLDYFNRKDKPYWYIDTHSGAALYDLGSREAQKVGEYRKGIGLLRRAFSGSGTPAESADGLPSLAAFVHHLDSITPPDAQPPLYPGSPKLADSLLRRGDKLRLFELHPADFALLQQQLHGRHIIARCADGYDGLIALLPPPTRRAVVLIDPPYEQKQDYDRAVHTLKEALKRFANGCYLLWYPCLQRPESIRLPEKLAKAAPNRLRAELHISRPAADGYGMSGSGLFVVNPPYILRDTLAAALPELVRILAQDDGARFVLDGKAA